MWRLLEHFSFTSPLNHHPWLTLQVRNFDVRDWNWMFLQSAYPVMIFGGEPSKHTPSPLFFFVSWASSQELDLNLHLEGTSTRDDKLRKFLDCSIFQEAMAWMWELHSITNWCVSSIYSRCFKGTLNGHSDSWYWPVISPGIHAVPKISSSYHTHVEWYVEVWHGKQPLEWFFLQASKNKIITDLMRKLRIWWLKPESKVRQKQNGEWGCTW